MFGWLTVLLLTYSLLLLVTVSLMSVSSCSRHCQRLQELSASKQPLPIESISKEKWTWYELHLVICRCWLSVRQQRRSSGASLWTFNLVLNCSPGWEIWAGKLMSQLMYFWRCFSGCHRGRGKPCQEKREWKILFLSVVFSSSCW